MKQSMPGWQRRTRSGNPYNFYNPRSDGILLCCCICFSDRQDCLSWKGEREKEEDRPRRKVPSRFQIGSSAEGKKKEGIREAEELQSGLSPKSYS